MKDYYKLLNISPKATTVEVDEAYLKFRENLLKYYPAQGIDPDSIIQKQFPDVVEAHQVLRVASLRENYDIEWRNIFGVEEIKPINVRQKENLVLVEFNPDRQKRKNIGLLLFILGIIGASVAVIAIVIVLTLIGMDGHATRIWKLAISLFVLSAFCILYGKFFSSFLKRVKKIRNLERVDNSFILHLRNGETEKVQAITFYKYFVVDFLFVNYYTESGKVYSLYTPALSSYKSDYSIEEIANHGANCNVAVSKKQFLFLNTFFDVPSKKYSSLENHKTNFLRLGFGVLLIPILLLSLYLPFDVVMGRLEFNPDPLETLDYFKLGAIALNPLFLQIFVSLNNIF